MNYYQLSVLDGLDRETKSAVVSIDDRFNKLKFLPYFGETDTFQTKIESEVQGNGIIEVYSL